MEGFITKIDEATNTIYGWVLLLVMVIIDYVAGYGTIVCIAVIAVVMDAVWGIASARKQGRFALSELARNTLSKLTVYGCCLILFIGLDKMLLTGGLTSTIVCSLIVLVEIWSTCASMLICNPNMPFLLLLKKALLGEIGRKLNVEPEKVEEALRNIETKSPSDLKQDKKNEKH